MKDISRAVKYIRKNAEHLMINPEQLIASGYLAGGHLVGSLAVHFARPELHTEDEYKNISNRPNAVMLNYALVSYHLLDAVDNESFYL